MRTPDSADLQSAQTLNRLELAAFNLGDNSQPHRYSTSNITYDKNGNILSLTRKGHTNAGATVLSHMDKLEYYYDSGNKLTRVKDSGHAVYGFKDSTADNQDYWYDDNGNMVRDLNKGIGTSSADGISYNHLNLPIQIKFDNSDQKKITYIYDAAGVKLRKVVEQPSVSSVTTDYAGNYIYENSTLQFFNHAEGYVEPGGSGGYDYIYHYKDHLGNIRLSYSDVDADGAIDVEGVGQDLDGDGTSQENEIVEENNYYPFGLQHKGYNNVVNGTRHQYMHAGKELQEELGANFYDFETRGYDPALGRFMQIDELSIVQTSWTPYHYNANNPIRFTDPTGLLPTYDWATNTYRDDNGIEISWQEALAAYGIDTGGGSGENDKKKDDKKDDNEEETEEETEQWDNTAITSALATSGVLLADDATGIGVVDDVAIPFVLVGGVTVYLYDNKELIAKQLDEIERILEKKLGPSSGFLYELRATTDGYYPIMTSGSKLPTGQVFLKAGEVWKYGETTKGFGRYSGEFLKSGRLSMIPIFFGNAVEIKVQEKIMIYGYALMKGKLPPGNKIFR
ncbi:RHS repeat domain-containing protein [Poritiphilus flavus]|uniref:RHS repeat-associated core domain-containing protein n=1 Tax=Poritiphilus flavus TaxID=2697053 RepID=A0A6L9EDQ4_9FLAO|nr:RHS repeat-associated core domain-containing protein [Poritiphilus flavus]NAS12904.1 hypothetical protein [Poritiphilus flavus]